MLYWFSRIKFFTKMRITMKRIDFENGTVTENILSAALPMLAAQILSLLYNIVDRIYIGRIPDVGSLEKVIKNRQTGS